MFLFGPPNIEKLKTKGDVNGLIHAIKYQKDKAIPRSAVHALGEIRDPRALETLIAILTAEDDQGDSYLRILAIEGLGNLGDPRGITPLLHTLENSDPEMRFTAVQALNDIAKKGVRENRVIDPLVSRLNDRVPRVRNRAAAALQEYGWQPGRDLNGAVFHISQNHWDQLVDIGEPAIEPLRQLIYGGKTQSRPGDPSTKENAIRVLGEIGGEGASKVLFDILKGNSEFSISDSITAEKALTQIAKKTVEPFLTLFSDNTLSDNTYRVIIEGLEQNRSQQARDTLTTLLGHKRPFVQKLAAYALAGLGDTRVLPVLENILETGLTKEKGLAITALGELGSVEVIPLLRNILSRAYEPGYAGPLEEAGQALEKLGWQPDSVEISAIYYLKLNQLDKCIAIGEPAIAPLIILLQNGTGKVAEVLEKMGPPAVEPLCAALKKDAMASAGFTPTKLPPGASIAGENWYYKSAGFREIIINILGNIGDPRAIETLTWVSKIDHYVVDMLENEEIAAKDLRWPVREAAKVALEKIAKSSSQDK